MQKDKEKGKDKDKDKEEEEETQVNFYVKELLEVGGRVHRWEMCRWKAPFFPCWSLVTRR